MQRATRGLWAASLGLCSFLSRNANATTDLPGQYDARAVAIGGTGVSYVENGASVYLNPAALDGIKTFAGTLAISPIRTTLTTPVAGPESSVKSDSPFFPLFLAGAGYRISDRVVLGLAVYPTAGFGATYTGAIGGQDLSFGIAQVEASPAISFKVIDGLSLGLGYRITYTSETGHQPPPLAPAPTDINLTGTSFFGLHAGVYYRPIEAVHLGLTYRSRVKTSLSGTTESSMGKFDTTSAFDTPDRFRLGASVTVPGTSLMVAADVKYLLYSVSNKSIDTTITTPMGPLTSSQPLNWKDVFAFGLGVEDWLVPIFAVRAGYSMTQTATPDETANPFTPPPGVVHSAHLGVGLKLPALDLDLGGFYSIGSKHLSATGPSGPVPGDYKLNTLLMSLSATYHM